jgi:hypothetical protein
MPLRAFERAGHARSRCKNATFRDFPEAIKASGAVGHVMAPPRAIKKINALALLMVGYALLNRASHG